jgi:hypothetical protein
MFRTFDFASPDTTSPQRFSTTVPQQALFLMNSPFLVQQAKELAQRPEVRAAENDDEKVQAMYRIAFNRSPDADELRLAKEFVTAQPEEAQSGEQPKRLSKWEKLAQVLLLANELMFVD